MRLLILGGGFTGRAVAHHARARGHEVVATTRCLARAASLRSDGVDAIVLSDLGVRDALTAVLTPDTRVLVTFPPDGATDAALGPGVARAAGAVYVSSTGVYGDASGRVDEDTPVDRRAPRSAARLDAEEIWRRSAATVVRAPAIYGPGRGMHLRLARGELRLGPERGNAISRIHVDDLAVALLALLEHPRPGTTYVVGDDEPAPQNEVVRWLCGAMRIPLPGSSDAVDQTLQHDRRVAPSRLRADLGVACAFPTFRDGFRQCLAADAALIDEALDARGVRRAP